MNALEKLKFAKKQLTRSFSEEISKIYLLEENFRLTLVFSNNYRLFIRYNDFGEYSYQFQYSSQPNDFLRYDNFDDHWPVDTKPHHLHIGNDKVVESDMKGDPEKDIPLLSKKIQSKLRLI